MTIANRVSRIFKADIHGILDSLEHPEAVLRQAVRDMEEQLRCQEAEQKTLEKRLSQFKKVQRDHSKLHEEIQKQIELCFKTNHDDLARNFVRKKLEINYRSTILAKRFEVMSVRKSELEMEIKRRPLKRKYVKEFTVWLQNLFTTGHGWAPDIPTPTHHLPATVKRIKKTSRKKAA